MSQQGPPQPTPVYVQPEQWAELIESVKVIRQSVYLIACIIGASALLGAMVGFFVLTTSD